MCTLSNREGECFPRPTPPQSEMVSLESQKNQFTLQESHYFFHSKCGFYCSTENIFQAHKTNMPFKSNCKWARGFLTLPNQKWTTHVDRLLRLQLLMYFKQTVDLTAHLFHISHGTPPDKSCPQDWLTTPPCDLPWQSTRLLEPRNSVDLHFTFALIVISRQPKAALSHHKSQKEEFFQRVGFSWIFIFIFLLKSA